MSFLSGLTNLNPLSMLSNAVEATCDKILPKDLEFVGDIAGLVTDIRTGNYMKCLDDVQDLLSDLPQQLNSLVKKGADATDAGGKGSPALEPTPPEPYCSAADETDDTPVATAKEGAKSAPDDTAPSAHANANQDGKADGKADESPTLAPRHGFGDPTVAHQHGGGSVKGPVQRGAPPASSETARGPKPSTDDTTAKQHESTRGSTTSGARSGETSSSSSSRTSSSSKAEKASASDESDTTKTTSDLKTTDPAKAEGTATSSNTAKVSDGMSADAFFKLSDKSLMDAVRDGKIPESVSKDPEQMRRLQMRMNDITEMNHLITSILNALHDMKKEIIQNLRA